MRAAIMSRYRGRRGPSYDAAWLLRNDTDSIAAIRSSVGGVSQKKKKNRRRRRPLRKRIIAYEPPPRRPGRSRSPRASRNRSCTIRLRPKRRHVHGDRDLTVNGSTTRRPAWKLTRQRPRRHRRRRPGRPDPRPSGLKTVGAFNATTTTRASPAIRSARARRMRFTCRPTHAEHRAGSASAAAPTS